MHKLALMIDDRCDYFNQINEALIEKKWKCKYATFDNAFDKIRANEPDLIILDLMLGSAEEDPEGSAGADMFNKLKAEVCCPIIIHSANPSLHLDDNKKTPLLEKVKKGKGSHNRVADAVDKMSAVIDGITEVKTEFKKFLMEALWELTPGFIGSEEQKTFPGNDETYVYLARRRVAAMLDETIFTGRKLTAWEQYIYPALGEHPLFGDVLYFGEYTIEAKNNIKNYRLVLSPSCDLVFDKKRSPKITKVLVAHCEGIKSVLSKEAMSFETQEDSELAAAEFRIAFTQGLANSRIPLPSIPNLTPDMCANLKRLELIDFNKDDGLHVKTGKKQKTKFFRIASVDSPFREQIAWSYMQVSCRPGVPDRDRDTWAMDVIKKLTCKTENESN